ncbi:MAG: glycosyltransferase family 9 protein [Candidatus Latescibacteria bacterium]|nr:glycosyltransferase family 9 protein [Candidatus Latescibacterota bacterium]
MWYSIEKTIKTWALHRLERRMPRREVSPEAVDWGRVRRVLIVRQHDQFGDFLLTTPAIRALRQRFPDAYLALVVREYLKPVAQGNPDVDELLVFPQPVGRWTPRDSLRLVSRLRDGFNLAVVFNTVSHSLSSDLIAYSSGAPLILGPALPTFDHCERNPFYTLVAPYDPAPKHQADRNLDVVRHIGADTDDLTYRFGLSHAEEQAGQALLRSLCGTNSRRTVGVHFGTKDTGKRFPIPRLAELCDRLVERGETEIIVIRAPDEDALLAALMSQMRHYVAVAPLLRLREVAGLLASLGLLVCNDTGVLHLAAAVGTPTVSFHAKSDPAFWKPIGDRHVAVYAANGDITTVTVDQAMGAVDRALGTVRPHTPRPPSLPSP